MMNTTTTALTTKRKKGRPTKYTPRIVNALCAHVRKGVPFVYCSALAGIALSSFFEWQNQYPKFRERILKARARGVASRLKLIQQAMDSGDVKAAQWWLEHVEAEHFAKNRIEISGPNGAPLAVGIGIYLPQKDGDANGTPVVTVDTVKEVENES